MENQKLDEIRQTTLDQIDVADKRVKKMIFAMVFVEGVMLTTYLAVMDFQDRLHWLLLIAAVLIYATICVGLVTVSAYIGANTQRILKAIELGLNDNKE